MAYPIDSGLYWSIAGPLGFIRDIELASSQSRVILINMPLRLRDRLSAGVEEGLKHARIELKANLTIRSGTNISRDIAVHYDETLMIAEKLAKIRQQCRTAIILDVATETARDECLKYVEKFLSSAETGEGNVVLIVAIHSEKIPELERGKTGAVVSFDGGLSEDEMSAYITLRTTSRTGPGSTRLVQGIISEFAGFDVDFAEQLCSMSEAEVLSIRSSMANLIAGNEKRWREDSWLNGTCSKAQNLSHPLRDAYLESHGNEIEKKLAKERLDTRFWRACLREITPWLEARRQNIIGRFKSAIKYDDSALDTEIEIPRGKTTRKIQFADLEYNNIVGLYYNNLLNITTPGERRALDVCRAAKKVRDEIAHMRMPSITDVSSLISNMDMLNKNSIKL